MDAGLSIISILALRQGVRHYTFVVYRVAIATALAWYQERPSRPKMTINVMAKIDIMVLSMFE